MQPAAVTHCPEGREQTVVARLSLAEPCASEARHDVLLAQCEQLANQRQPRLARGRFAIVPIDEGRAERALVQRVGDLVAIFS
jgi:hypothetical protein